MITTRVIPATTASATSQELLVEISEQVCKPYCINSAAKPSASVIFSQGTVTTVNGVAVIPITATVTIVTPTCNGCGCAHTQVITERFNLGMTATTANSVTLEPGDSTTVEPTDLHCCKARGVKLTTTLVVGIA